MPSRSNRNRVLSFIFSLIAILVLSTATAAVQSLPLGFAKAVSYYSGGGMTMAVAITDFNGDGKLDIVTANQTGNNVGVLLGNGDGTFRPTVTYSSGGSGPTSVAVADLNGDSYPDLVVTNRCAITLRRSRLLT